MLGMGKIVGPNEYGIYVWKTDSLDETQATIALLWNQLGSVKRAQASVALKEVLDGYRTGHLRARARSVPRRAHLIHVASETARATTGDLERAWAAGFLDAEGSFGIRHSQPRKRGPDWYRLRVSASQHGEIGVPAGVLTRLQEALGSLGRIERHGDPDDFRWFAEGADAIEDVLSRTAPWLGAVKTEQAQRALDSFRAQVRFRGSALRCRRGHEYTGSSMRGGRFRRICRPCDRLNARLRRAAAGIPPRRFRDAARRYTF